MFSLSGVAETRCAAWSHRATYKLVEAASSGSVWSRADCLWTIFSEAGFSFFFWKLFVFVQLCLFLAWLVTMGYILASDLGLRLVWAFKVVFGDQAFVNIMFTVLSVLSFCLLRWFKLIKMWNFCIEFKLRFKCFYDDQLIIITVVSTPDILLESQISNSRIGRILYNTLFLEL